MSAVVRASVTRVNDKDAHPVVGWALWGWPARVSDRASVTDGQKDGQ
jgi:hypothetical protein